MGVDNPPNSKFSPATSGFDFRGRREWQQFDFVMVDARKILPGVSTLRHWVRIIGIDHSQDGHSALCELTEINRDNVYLRKKASVRARGDDLFERFVSGCFGHKVN
jgi:hypothetical protein